MPETDGDLETLIRLGANINGQDDTGQTRLLRLIRELKPDISEGEEGHLIHNGETSGSSDAQAIHAIREIRAWLRRSHIDINLGDNWGQTPLHAAAVVDSKLAPILLKTLMSRPNVDINPEDELGRTPLTWAMHCGKESTVHILMQTPGIDISKARMQGESALINAAHQGWTHIVISLLKDLNHLGDFVDVHGQNILHWTIFMGMMDAFEMALEKDASILAGRDTRGMTPLHLAASEGQFHAVKLLLARGANPLDKTKFGETALHLAAAGGHLRILKALIQALPSSSPINEKDSMGWTLAHHAVVSGSDQLVRYIVSLKEVDLTKVDRHGRTPFAFAAWLASFNILDMFFQVNTASADMEFMDAFGNTLLHLAARGNNESTLPYFLKNLPDKGNLLNRWEKTALDMVPSTSPLRNQLVASGLHHSQKFLTEIKTSLLDTTREEDPPLHLDWIVTVPPAPEDDATIASKAAADDGIRVG
ncbi:hypothetical protein N7470_004464 [Penicillium chermesinum]|nr:hypothetical protein N7470_004464 [Penicillium chermesinum]